MRGVARLGEAFALIPLVKRRVPEVQLPFEDRGRGLRWWRRARSRPACAVAARARSRARGAVALLSIAPTALALKDSDLAAYHGVEHKAIAGYEQDTDAADAAKEHERCGSNLVAPMMISTVAGNALARALFACRGPVAERVVTLGSAAFAVELLGLVGAPPGDRRWRVRSRCPATRCSACSRRGSRPPSSSRSAASRWPRYCASREACPLR